jgi:pantothenate kinase-related protein Tda10
MRAVQLTVHCAKNFLAESLTKIRVPLILGVWGGKGQGKTFQVLIRFAAAY